MHGGKSKPISKSFALIAFFLVQHSQVARRFFLLQHGQVRRRFLLLQRLVTPRDQLETLNMKLHFVIGESHLTLSEVSMREQGQEDYKPEKKVADLHWLRTDSTLTASACLNTPFSYILTLAKKNGSD